MRAPLLAALALACTQTEISAFEPATLEAATVLVGPEVDFDAGNRRDFVGDLTVEDDGGGDWHLTLRGSGGTHELDVHSPARSDLSGLDGLTDARLSVQRDPASREVSLAVVDADDVVRYLVEPAEPGVLTNDLFGAGLVARGEELGPAQDAAWDLTLSAGVLRTDDGDVELLPGEPQQVALDGLPYRAVLLASFEADLRVESDVSCTGARERLACELLQADGGDLTPLVRADNQPLPTSTCLPK
ncbi:MAG: hypothetical protein R3F59_01800 [Myxococcota bacterium]